MLIAKIIIKATHMNFNPKFCRVDLLALSVDRLSYNLPDRSTGIVGYFKHTWRFSPGTLLLLLFGNYGSKFIPDKSCNRLYICWII